MLYSILITLLFMKFENPSAASNKRPSGVPSSEWDRQEWAAYFDEPPAPGSHIRDREPETVRSPDSSGAVATKRSPEFVPSVGSEGLDDNVEEVWNPDSRPEVLHEFIAIGRNKVEGDRNLPPFARSQILKKEDEKPRHGRKAA